mmetsp:Transcript_11583/g.35873  ORF Transcript_11583/g.35873 Transcript_11583/m.35873 type:complete len:507 (-) Transcript_11583:725-2245(-)
MAPPTLRSDTVCCVGGGPAALFFAHLYLSATKHTTLRLLERGCPPGTAAAADRQFGFGLGRRALRSLDAVPGLVPEVLRHSAPVRGAHGLQMIARDDMCRVLTQSLRRRYGRRVSIEYGIQASAVRLGENRLDAMKLEGPMRTPSTRREYAYEVLVAADGLHSIIRRQLEAAGHINVEAMARPFVWKALRLRQTHELDPATFMSLRRGDVFGAVLPRPGGGHTILLFWPQELTDANSHVMLSTRGVNLSSNPWGVTCERDLRHELVAAEPRLASGLVDVDLRRFLHTAPGRELAVKCSNLNVGRVALLGDAAHGMYSTLGQGCACAFNSAEGLAKALASVQASDQPDIPVVTRSRSLIASIAPRTGKESWEAALAQYSSSILPQGHAATDLNLLSHFFYSKNGLVQRLCRSLPLLHRAPKLEMKTRPFLQTPLPMSQLSRVQTPSDSGHAVDAAPQLLFETRLGAQINDPGSYTELMDADPIARCALRALWMIESARGRLLHASQY